MMVYDHRQRWWCKVFSHVIIVTRPYYYYLIKFNVRIEPLGYGRLNKTVLYRVQTGSQRGLPCSWDSSTWSEYVPQSQNGSIFVTSRSRDVAFRITRDTTDIIPVDRVGTVQRFRRHLCRTPAGSKSTAKRVVGRWCLVTIDGAIMMLLKSHESKRRKGTSLRKCNYLFRIVATEVIKRSTIITIPVPNQSVTPPTGAQVLPTCRLNRRSKWWITPPKKYACQYGSSWTRGHAGGCQGDFKGPVQHKAEGQRCSTWRPDYGAMVRAKAVLIHSNYVGYPACVLQFLASLAFIDALQCY
jgi:hypothetical protein